MTFIIIMSMKCLTFITWSCSLIYDLTVMTVHVCAVSVNTVASPATWLVCPEKPLAWRWVDRRQAGFTIFIFCNKLSSPWPCPWTSHPHAHAQTNISVPPGPGTFSLLTSTATHTVIHALSHSCHDSHESLPLNLHAYRLLTYQFQYSILKPDQGRLQVQAT